MVNVKNQRIKFLILWAMIQPGLTEDGCISLSKIFVGTRHIYKPEETPHDLPAMKSRQVPAAVPITMPKVHPNTKAANSHFSLPVWKKNEAAEFGEEWLASGTFTVKSITQWVRKKWYKGSNLLPKANLKIFQSGIRQTIILKKIYENKHIYTIVPADIRCIVCNKISKPFQWSL